MKMIYEAPKGWRLKNRGMWGLVLYAPKDSEDNLWWHHEKVDRHNKRQDKRNKIYNGPGKVI